MILGVNRKEDPKDATDTVPSVEETIYRGSHKVSIYEKVTFIWDNEQDELTSLTLHSTCDLSFFFFI